jgi:hypothetical protein
MSADQLQKRMAWDRNGSDMMAESNPFYCNATPFASISM